ncbi:MAG TPA: DNA polymerase III subunit alpha [Limnochordia bacterium]|nr:DNA polymerase III subunit alpha [Limnochordia bacterium]
MPYVELHAHSAYSFLDGASLPEELVARAAELGYGALALTDHDGLYGAMAFAHLCRDHGLKPITGAELSLPDDRHLTLLAADRTGYGNLCRLITAAHLPHPKGEPCLDPTQLGEHARGLIVLSGCRRGEIARLAAAGRLEEAVAAARALADTFGRENVYIELQHNDVKGDVALNERLSAVARQAGLRTAATGNVHYHLPRRHRLQDVLVAIRHRSTLDNSHQVRRPNADFYLKSPAEAAARFARWPEAVAETERIAERINFDLTQDLGYAFPDFRAGEGKPAALALRELCEARLVERYQSEPPERRAEARERLAEELRLVEHHKLSGFFLVYHDLMELAGRVADQVRGRSAARRAVALPPGRGRGSSVSSIICYLIGLSHVDPVKNKLFLGRFLNESLHSVPDIDLDFARDIREALILAVYQQYGREHAALVCSFPTYQLRMAVREVGKALALPEIQLDRLAKLCEGRSSRDLAEQMRLLPEFAAKADEPVWRELIELAYAIAGFPRHISQHVGGMIISAQPLVELVPLENARMEGRVVCQWDKDACDDARFIKVDFLALGMLSLVEECLEHIYTQTGRSVDLSRIGFDDARVYDDICAGDTMGMFQIESRAQIQMLPRTRPRNLDDLAVQVAIIRPGPIVGGAVNPYVKRRQMLRENPNAEIEYDHPLLEPALAETLGVILFQDQVMQVAQDLAGFSAGEADALRRAMSRKRSREALAEYEAAFRKGAAAKGVPAETADAIFAKIVGFSEFGFPKSHSYAFAVLAYQSAWLRTYHPAPYYAALFNNQPMGFYPPHVLVRDAQRKGVQILAPCIGRSAASCTVETLPDGAAAVRLGLRFVAEVRARLAADIVAERTARGPYTGLEDFGRRVSLQQNEFENLILAGALDSFGESRRRLLWQLGLSFRPRFGLQRGDGRTKDAQATPAAAIAAAIKAPSPAGGAGAARERPARWVQAALPLPALGHKAPLTEMPEGELVATEYALLGLSTRAHVLAGLRPLIPARIQTVQAVSEAPDETRLETCGLVITRQRPQSAHGFVFLLIEDETGLLNVIIRPKLYEERRQVIRSVPLIALRGVTQNKEGTLNFVAEAVWPLEVRSSIRAGQARDIASHDFY